MNASGLSKSGRSWGFGLSLVVMLLLLMAAKPLMALAAPHSASDRVRQGMPRPKVRTPKVKAKKVRDDRPKVKTSDKKKSAKDADVQEPRQYFDGH